MRNSHEGVEGDPPSIQDPSEISRTWRDQDGWAVASCLDLPGTNRLAKLMVDGYKHSFHLFHGLGPSLLGGMGKAKLDGGCEDFPIVGTSSIGYRVRTIPGRPEIPFRL